MPLSTTAAPNMSLQHSQLCTEHKPSCGDIDCHNPIGFAKSNLHVEAEGNLHTVSAGQLLTLNSTTAFALLNQPRATELLYSVRAPPAPTPSVDPSPPIEMSTGGLISEHFARAYSDTNFLNSMHFTLVGPDSNKQDGMQPENAFSFSSRNQVAQLLVTIATTQQSATCTVTRCNAMECCL